MEIDSKKPRKGRASTAKKNSQENLTRKSKGKDKHGIHVHYRSKSLRGRRERNKN